MKSILLSIKPDYANSILSGKKRYEYRRIRSKEKVERIFIYATSPIQKVVGEVTVEDVVSDLPIKVWNQTKTESGMDWESFRNYFSGSEIAHAYALGTVAKYETPKELSEFHIAKAPQSFVYIEVE